MSEEKPFKPRAVILDMDGLILDTEGPSINCWIEAGRRFGREIPRALVLCAIGLNKAATRALFLGEYGQGFPFDEMYAETYRLMKESMARNGIACRPGLAEFLACLEGRGTAFAVATSTDRKTARWKLERAGVLDRFPLMVCGDEIERGKPAPDIFLAAARLLGANPPDCVGFEDSGPGLMGLAAAGIRPVFIRDIAEPPPEALASVWRQYSDLAEAREIFV
jgi:HAD superfamily hydrolase (TIGR01509 family)